MLAALIAKLLATGAITALVGNRITPTRREQGGALPAVVVHLAGGTVEYHLSGDSGLRATRVQIDCWGASQSSANAVATAVKAALSGARFTQGGVRFDGILIESDDRTDSFTDAPDTVFRTSFDLMIHYAS